MRISSNRYRILPAAPVLALLLAGCDPLHARRYSRADAAAEPPRPPLPAAALPQAAAPAAPPPLTAEQRRVRALIQQVEAAYSQRRGRLSQGQAARGQGRVRSRRRSLCSPAVSISRAIPPLQDEFDHIVDAVNGLEMDALKEGNGFVPKTEPTPADVASDVTFEVDPNIVAKARTDLATTKSDLPLVVNDYVAGLHQLLCRRAEGPQHAAALLSARRPLQGDDSARDGRRGRAPGSDLPGRGRVRLSDPAPSMPTPGAGGMWQFMPHGDYGLTRNGVCRRAFLSGKIHARLRALHEVHLRPAGRLVSGHGGLRLGRGQCAARSAENRLRRLLGTLQAQQPAGRDQLCTRNSCRHHHCQSSHAIWVRRCHPRPPCTH